ncbi:MAG: hypothetical protein ACOY4I_05295 [Bacillota bacterium]
MIYEVQIVGITAEAATVIAQNIFGQFSGAMNFLTGCVLGVGCALAVIKGLVNSE